MSWLGDQLSVYVGDKVPTTAQLPGVVVNRLGGPRTNLSTEDATVTFECYAKDSWPAANALAREARTAVWNLTGRTVDGVTFVKVSEFAGPGRLWDDVAKQVRVVFTASLRVRTLA